MCGVAGILNLDGQPCDRDDLTRFTDSLYHRGPDGAGVHVDGPLGLGHRRLAILDLSEAGHQPMACLGRRYWITYNGEVYNFLELRRELEAEGHAFVSETDTEVIVAAYHRWGSECVHRFNGMWAFAIWDTERRELFLSRDRFGVKPLRYLSEPRRFAFASETKSFLHLRGFTAREDEKEMRNAIARGGNSAQGTVLKGVKRLPGGHNMLVSAEGVRIWRWWRTVDHLPAVPRRLDDQAEAFRELFFDAVRLRLRSDVPVASCLSGGLDSSSIVCALPKAGETGNRQAADFHHAFVATFAGTLWDEREYADAAIERSGVEAHMVPIEVGSVIEHVRQYAADYEMAGGHLSIPLWFTYRALRQQGIVVSLDGHGADEMMGGYARAYQAALRGSSSFLSQPFRTLDLIQTMQGIYDTGVIERPTTTDMIIESDAFLRSCRRTANSARRAVHRAIHGAPLVHAGAGPWAPEVPKIAYADENTAEIVEAMGPFRGWLYKEFHSTTLPNVLRSFDRCSMAHGVEIRMPFLDWRLATFVFALPDTSIAGGGFTKRILREAMRGVLPEKIRTRKAKMGFSSPMPDWFNGPLGEWVAAEVQTPSFLDSDLWNGPIIRDYVRERQARRDWTLENAQRGWRFVQAHLWRQSAFGA